MKKKYIVPNSAAVNVYTANGMLENPYVATNPSQTTTTDPLTKSRHEENYEEKDWGDVDKSIW